MVSNKTKPKNNNNKYEMKKKSPVPNSIASIQHQEKVPFSSWKVLIILSFIATMVMYAETMLIPAIPTLVKDFHINYGLSSWLLTAYLVSAAVMTPIAGKLSDIYGRKKVLLVIMAIYTTGVVVGAISNDIYLMIFGRAIQGIGMSMFPIAFGMVRDQFPLNKLSIAQGLITSMFAIGAVIGLSVGGIIIQYFGWRMTFITIIPISIILLLVIKKYICESNYYGYENQNLKSEIKTGNKKNKIKTKHQNLEKVEKASKGQIDIKGSALLAILITSLLLGITLLQPDSSKGNVSPNGDTVLTVLPIFVVSLVSLILFILVERRSMHPLMNFKIFLESKILFSSIIIMIVGLSMFMVFQTIPILVQTPKPIGFSGNPSDTGQIQLPFAIVLLLFGPTSGLIISKLGSMKPTILGSVLTTTGFMIILLLHSSEILISVGLTIVSAGLSLAAVGAMNIILVATPREFSGVTIGMSSMLRIVGSSIGPALAAMYMQTNQSTIATTNGITEMLPSSLSFDLIFLTAVILSSISIFISLFLMKKAKSPSKIIV
ncbi:MFS transporter [Candidatus Nitrosocosmicus sp. SS]|jgi:MFS family permease|uniref:MFS transporter n=1 Tax=Candidatus Nitrosocosmicus agrestis TaxID=2563600 RepID=UPI00122DDD94|nr:MFS transporter [Candidatus Nitrosocosmicus sp. SS]KAA2283577.1 MFS transporter [Candidatus Nitrosocosmicus sp. SS]KAF0869659.1 MFS transporter [Candidatus Nitrosocosmicus sp. SS]